MDALISEWRRAAQELNHEELLLQGVRGELESAKMERDLLLHGNDCAERDNETTEQLQERLSRLTKDADELHLQSNELESWCKLRSTKSKKHLESMREMVADVREREEAIKEPVEIGEEGEELEKMVRTFESTLQEVTHQVESLTSHWELYRRGEALERELSELDDISGTAHDAHEEAEQDNQSVSEALEEIRTAAAIFEQYRKEIMLDMTSRLCPTIQEIANTVSRLSTPFFPTQAMERVQTALFRFSELRVEGTGETRKRKNWVDGLDIPSASTSRPVSVSSHWTLTRALPYPE